MASKLLQDIVQAYSEQMVDFYKIQNQMLKEVLTQTSLEGEKKAKMVSKAAAPKDNNAELKT